MTQPDTQRPRSAESDEPLTQNDRQWRKGDLELQIALAKGSTVRHAARAAGISERTAYRRLADPQFRSELKVVRERLLTTRIQHEAAGPQRDDPSGEGGAPLSGGSEAPGADTAARGPAEEEPRRSGATPSVGGPAPSCTCGTQRRRSAVRRKCPVHGGA